jgi:hypothetical protein
MEQKWGVNKKSAPSGALFSGQVGFTFRLSVTTGSRESGAVIKVKRKISESRFHAGRYFMLADENCQGGNQEPT